MKKTLLYPVIAVVLGLSLTLVPATIFAESRFENGHVWIASFSKQLEEFKETYSTTEPRQSFAEFTILAVSLAVALFVYVLVKRRMSQQNYNWIRPY